MSTTVQPFAWASSSALSTRSGTSGRKPIDNLLGRGFTFDCEPMQAALASPKCEDEMIMSDPKVIIDEFCTICEQAWIDYNLYLSVVETEQRNLHLYTSIAPMFFEDINRILIVHLNVQFSKLTDRANIGKNANLTTNYIVKELFWPDNVRENLRQINDRLMAFRKHIEPARSNRTVHIDLSAQINRVETLGAFPKGAEKQFLQDLQMFVNIAYGHFHDGASRPIDVAMSTDTHQLVRALEKSVVFDHCSRCDADERAVAVLNYKDLSE
jgi:hypothetical protein